MDAEVIERRREDLVAQRRHLREEISGMGGDPDSDEAAFDVERGFADSAQSTAERGRLLSVMRALRSNLRWVERALRKMELGTYGVCESCGLPIAAERLDALPWAALCVGCKARGEGR